MKSLKFLSILGLLLASASASVWADHGHTRIGVGMYFGAPVSPWYYSPPAYYPPPYYYQPRVVVVPAAPPPVYIEQQVAPPAPLVAAPPPQQSYWYYCRSANAYYPYVKDCPEGWEQVLAQTQPR